MTQVFERCRVLVWLGGKIGCEPQIIGRAMLFMTGATLLINPEGLAPHLAGMLAFLPVVPTLRQLGQSADGDPQGVLTSSDATKDRSRALMDYWVVMGGVTLVEQVLGYDMIGELLPMWCFAKGIAVI